MTITREPLLKKGPSVVNALSVDVEEWYQTVLYYGKYASCPPESSMEQNIEDILSILDSYGVKATFFVTAILSGRYREALKRIASLGHEIASHGYRHRSVYTLSPEEFSLDLKDSVKALEDIAQKKVVGYRAPTWSITPRMGWAIDMLLEQGFIYDSSVYSVGAAPVEGGLPWYDIRDGLIEFPPSVRNIFGCAFPFAGGTFMRFLPHAFITSAVTSLNRAGVPALIYLHSWEFDERIPAGAASPWKRFIQYGNLRSVKSKMRILLEGFRFSAVKEVLGL